MMLYESATGSLASAEEALGRGDQAEWLKQLGKVTEIITHLLTALRPEESAELAGNLQGLYVYMQGELAAATFDQAGLKRVHTVAGLLGTLAEGWRGVIRQQSEPVSAYAGKAKGRHAGYSGWTA